MDESALLNAKNRALTLLSMRAYTCQGLYRKLEALYGGEAAQAAVERMLELGLMDDEDYACRFAGDAMSRRGLSPARVIRELTQKGIDRELAERAVSVQEEDPQTAIARIIKKKYIRLLGDEKGLRKAYNALIRLGYRYGDIRATLGHLQEDEEYYDV